MNLTGAKVIVLLLLGFIKLGSGLAPWLLVKYIKKEGMKWMENFMAGLMCFGGGVLLATVFIHMLPEVRDSLALSYIDAYPEIKETTGLYPFGEVVLCGGFFLIYFIEAAVQKIFFHIHGHSHGVPTGASSENGFGHHKSDSEDGEYNSAYTTETESEMGSTATIKVSPKPSNKKDTVLDAKAKEKKLLSSIRSFVIVMALSVHAIFEGMAIGKVFEILTPKTLPLAAMSLISGLQLNETDVWKLFIAVAIHECAILFCVRFIFKDIHHPGDMMLFRHMPVCHMRQFAIVGLPYLT